MGRQDETRGRQDETREGRQDETREGKALDGGNLPGNGTVLAHDEGGGDARSATIQYAYASSY